MFDSRPLVFGAAAGGAITPCVAPVPAFSAAIPSSAGRLSCLRYSAVGAGAIRSSGPPSSRDWTRVGAAARGSGATRDSSRPARSELTTGTRVSCDWIRTRTDTTTIAAALATHARRRGASSPCHHEEVDCEGAATRAPLPSE